MKESLSHHHLSPHEGTELFLLVGVEFGQLALARLELLLVVGEIPHVKPVFSRFLLELVNNFLEASDGHQCVVVILPRYFYSDKTFKIKVRTPPGK